MPFTRRETRYKKSGGGVLASAALVLAISVSTLALSVSSGKATDYTAQDNSDELQVPTLVVADPYVSPIASFNFGAGDLNDGTPVTLSTAGGAAFSSPLPSAVFNVAATTGATPDLCGPVAPSPGGAGGAGGCGNGGGGSTVDVDGNPIAGEAPSQNGVGGKGANGTWSGEVGGAGGAVGDTAIPADGSTIHGQDGVTAPAINVGYPSGGGGGGGAGLYLVDLTGELRSDVSGGKGGNGVGSSSSYYGSGGGGGGAGIILSGTTLSTYMTVTGGQGGSGGQGNMSGRGGLRAAAGMALLSPTHLP